MQHADHLRLVLCYAFKNTRCCCGVLCMWWCLQHVLQSSVTRGLLGTVKTNSPPIAPLPALGHSGDGVLSPLLFALSGVVDLSSAQLYSLLTGWPRRQYRSGHLSAKLGILFHYVLLGT